MVKKLVKFIKDQEASGLLSSLEIKTSLNKVHLLGPFCFTSIEQVKRGYRMN